MADPGAMQSPFLLQRLDVTEVDFIKPIKQINSGDDLGFFLTSTAYRELKIWILQLSRACLPIQQADHVELHQLDSYVPCSPAVRAVSKLLEAFASMIAQAPPDTGPRRFGNVAFRRWMAILDKDIDQLLHEHLASVVGPLYERVSIELRSYLLESFGSASRLDYGTGHELSYLAFVGGLWKLNVFTDEEQWSIITATIVPYLDLVRTLIKTYTLEPAGSHGVWGLDDHCFIPYILGSAQLAPPLPRSTASMPYPPTPVEGSNDQAPEPASVTSLPVVDEQRSKNFYFAAIGFIYDVKKGPFFEHSPYLYNISGIKDGWGKINKGMLKMYDAEVLGKFPVVQHFPFGALWQWERDPYAIQPPAASVHAVNQPKQFASQQASTRAPSADAATQLPATAMPTTRAPWASVTSSTTRGQMVPPRAPRTNR